MNLTAALQIQSRQGGSGRGRAQGHLSAPCRWLRYGDDCPLRDKPARPGTTQTPGRAGLRRAVWCYTTISDPTTSRAGEHSYYRRCKILQRGRAGELRRQVAGCIRAQSGTREGKEASILTPILAWTPSARCLLPQSGVKTRGMGVAMPVQGLCQCASIIRMGLSHT